MKLDSHSKAYEVLLNKDSIKIAKNLGLKEPAHKADVCLDCHAHNVPLKLRGEKFDISEGVSCEGCHGGAEHWISSHTVSTATHSDNVKKGLYPTDQPLKQARLCLSCHFGDENRFVTHRIMGAGHPRMSFELNTFAVIEPAHYVRDADYVDRKGYITPTLLWMVGQAYSVQSLMKTLSDPNLNRDGFFPELVLFDCHSCHHPMSDKKWEPLKANYIGPGVIRINESSVLMLQVILDVVWPEEGKKFSRSFHELNRLMHSNSEKRVDFSLIEDKAKLIALQIDGVMLKMENYLVNQLSKKKILVKLIDDGILYRDYATAEQAFMAIVNLSNDLMLDGSIRVSEELRDSVSLIRFTVKDDENYNSDKFSESLAKFRAVLLAEGDF
tara:strand:+ start:16171 stop:17322 length:1152 start_codon:yes stop_codon:yes gene_type:complete